MTDLPIEGLTTLLPRALLLLASFAERALRPAEARAELRALARAYPELTLTLAWEEEDYARAIHYDLIVRKPGSGAVVLGWCPDRGLPFMARGAYRWSEDDLLRVEGRPLKVQDAVILLDLARSEELSERLVTALLLDAALEEHGLAAIEVPDAALQCALDTYRRVHGLLRAEDTARWLDKRGLSHAAFELLLERDARIVLLRERVVKERVDAHFAEHVRDFDQVVVRRVTVQARAEAEQVRAELGTAACDQALARKLAKEQASSELLCWRRYEAPSELRESLFTAATSEVLGPLQSQGRWSLLQVVARYRGELDEATRELVSARLFADWLSERRARAQVEWFWGQAREAAAQ